MTTKTEKIIINCTKEFNCEYSESKTSRIENNILICKSMSDIGKCRTTCCYFCKEAHVDCAVFDKTNLLTKRLRVIARIAKLQNEYYA